MKDQIILVSTHASRRLKERFGIKKGSALRFAKDIATNGTIISNFSNDNCIHIEKNGNTYIFSKTIDGATGKDALILVTACNEDKSSEWVVIVRGENRKFTSTKHSKVNRRLKQTL
ncbi:MAG: hypothetical protein WCW84_13180 [Sulfurimonas sp.]|jgi:hypothetical protein